MKGAKVRAMLAWVEWAGWGWRRVGTGGLGGREGYGPLPRNELNHIRNHGSDDIWLYPHADFGACSVPACG